MTHHLNKSGANSEPGTSGTDKDGLVPKKPVCQEEVFHIKSSAGKPGDYYIYLYTKKNVVLDFL